MLALVGGAIAIGLAPIFVRWSEVGPNATAFWRLAIALPPLWLLCRRTGGTRLPHQGRGLLVLAGVCFALDLCFWHASIARTSVANATLLANLTPIIVVLFYWLVRHQRPTPRFAFGTVLALAGAAGLALGSGSPAGTVTGVAFSGATDNRVLLGNLFGVITACAYAGYLLSVEQARSVAGGFQVMLVSTAVATLITGAVALGFGENLWPGSGTGWAVLAGLAVIVHVLGQGGIVWAIGQLPAPLSSVVILIQVVVAAGLGWWWLGEALGPLDVAWAVLVLAGVLVARRV